MKKVSLSAQLLVILGILCRADSPEPIKLNSPFACTSFAVYSGETIYGMNFDYPDVPVRFTIQDYGDLKVFQMEFKFGDGYSPTVGMNSAGLFASAQMLFPELPESPPGGGKEISIYQLYHSGLNHKTALAEVHELLSEYRVVNSGLTLHTLFADPGGSAVVVEADEKGAILTPIEGPFIVMTNFPNGSLQGKPYTEASGAGADRYLVVYENIENNLEQFNVELGFETLEKAVLLGESSTQASMVFDPEKMEIFVALNGRYDQLWKISLEGETIETYRGFSAFEKVAFDSTGVTESKMLAMGSNQAQSRDLILELSLILGIGASLGLIYRLRKKQPA
ncbi:MAG: hypothetical protein WBB69_12315 [Anaerolineales bacterium]